MGELLLPLLLVLLAIGLLFAEDLLPTGGVLGLLAAACLLFVLYLGYSNASSTGFRYLLLELAIVPVAYGAWALMLARTGVGKAAYLRPPEDDEVGRLHDRPDLDRLLGRRGTALTTLRPSGMVDFEGRRLDGVAEEGLIPAGSPVVAVHVRSGRLIVRVATDEANPGDA